MGRTQPHGIAGGHGTVWASLFEVRPACASLTFTASPGKARAWPKRLGRAVSPQTVASARFRGVRAPSSFRGWVLGVDRRRACGCRRPDPWGFRMLSDARPLLRDAAFVFIFCNGILARPADFCRNILLEFFRQGCFFGLVQGTLTPSAPK